MIQTRACARQPRDTPRAHTVSYIDRHSFKHTYMHTYIHIYIYILALTIANTLIFICTTIYTNTTAQGIAAPTELEMMRFLRARKFDVDAAVKQVGEALPPPPPLSFFFFLSLSLFFSLCFSPYLFPSACWSHHFDSHSFLFLSPSYPFLFSSLSLSFSLPFLSNLWLL